MFIWLFEDTNIEGTLFEEPFLVAVLWILRIPKFIESHKRMRENGHFNKEFRTHPTTWCNVLQDNYSHDIVKIFFFLQSTWCNAVIFWTICAHGFLAIRALAKNHKMQLSGFFSRIIFFFWCTWIFSQCIFWQKSHGAATVQPM